jgi:predicted transcriptional regulator
MRRERAERLTRELTDITSGIALSARGAIDQRVRLIQDGVPQALEMTAEEWAQTLTGPYERLELAERQEVHRELAENGLSQRQIAAATGSSQATVRRDLESNDSPEPEESSDDGESEGAAESNDSPEPEDDLEQQALDEAIRAVEEQARILDGQRIDQQVARAAVELVIAAQRCEAYGAVLLDAGWRRMMDELDRLEGYIQAIRVAIQERINEERAA